MPFELRREHGQSGKEEEPDREPDCVETAKPPGVGIENGRRRYHAASIQPQKALRRQLDGRLPPVPERRGRRQRRAYKDFQSRRLIVSISAKGGAAAIVMMRLFDRAKE